MTILSVIPLVPLAFHFLWPMLPVQVKPRWVSFLPAASLVLMLVDIFVDGFQPVLLGLYLLILVIFLVNLRSLLRYSPGLPTRRGWAIAGGLAGIMALVLCLIPALLFPFHYQAVAPTGIYGVGTVTYGWEDSQRLEAYTPDDTTDHRKIAVQFWYPADPGKAGPQADPLENAALSEKQAQYPVVVFSHGAFGVRGSNITTYMELASHGYIVASIDHAYHAFFTRFPDGDQAIISQDFLTEVQMNQSGELSEEDNYRITLNWLDLRVADMVFTLDQIEALNAGGEQSPFTGRMDLDKIGLFGHSLGGAASGAVCRADSRCKAAVVIDATMFGEYDREARDGTPISKPFAQPLMIFYNGDTYHATPEHLGYEMDIAAFENAAAPAYSVVVNGAQHLNFTDLPARAPLLARLLGSAMTVNGGTAGEIKQERCMEILDTYVLAFFNQALLGQPSHLLSGDTPFVEVEFSAHMP